MNANGVLRTGNFRLLGYKLIFNEELKLQSDHSLEKATLRKLMAGIHKKI